MAKTKGPLLSLDAHGSLSKLLTYSNRRTGQQVRQYNKPLATPTAKQRGQRRLTEFLVAQWQNMSAGTKATWEANAKASGLNIPGYQYFLREAQRDLYTHHGLCMYLHCNEIVGGKVLDLSGQGNNGTLKPNYPSNAPILTASKNSRLSKALFYDPTDDYIDCGNKNTLNVKENFTISLWLKMIDDSHQSYLVILRKYDPENYHDQYAVIWKSSNNHIFLQWYSPALGEDDYAISEASLNLNEWYWLVFTVGAEGGLAAIYINGKLDNTDDFPDTLQNTSPVTIGTKNNAIIDEPCIYNRVLSAEEILTRYKFATAEVPS